MNMKKLNFLLFLCLLFVSACNQIEEPSADFEDIFEAPSTWRGVLDADQNKHVEVLSTIYMHFNWRDGDIVSGTFFIMDNNSPDLPSGVSDFSVEYQGKVAKFKFSKEEYSVLDGYWLLYSNDEFCPRFYKGVEGSNEYYFILLNRYSGVAK